MGIYFFIAACFLFFGIVFIIAFDDHADEGSFWVVVLASAVWPASLFLAAAIALGFLTKKTFRRG